MNVHKYPIESGSTVERLTRENHSLRLQLESARRINDASVQQARDMGMLVDELIARKARFKMESERAAIDMVDFREAERAVADAEASLFAAIEDTFLVSAEKLRKALS